MNASERKEGIIRALEGEETPVNATQFAQQLGVSRQVIVGDIAILRASGHNIIATPRGYLLQVEDDKEVSNYSIACRHTREDMLEELYTIVDNGCAVLNVTVEHQIYGQLVGELQIKSRKDADRFAESLRASKQHLLSELTEQIHLHQIHCPSKQHYEDVKKELCEKGFLIHDNEE